MATPQCIFTDLVSPGDEQAGRLDSLYLFRLTRSSPIHLITFGANGSTLAAADYYHILGTHARQGILPPRVSVGQDTQRLEGHNRDGGPI